MVDEADANCGQMTQPEKDQLVGVLARFRDAGLFPLNPKRVPPCNGDKLRIPLIDEAGKPFTAKQQRYSVEECNMIRQEVAKLAERGIIQRSRSAWAAACVCVRKKDGTLRLCQDYRQLNARIKANSGGLGDIRGMFDRVKGSQYYSSIDLASEYFQMEIVEEDRHKTAFRDADGLLWEYTRASLGSRYYLRCLPAVWGKPSPHGNTPEQRAGSTTSCYTVAPLRSIYS